MRITAIALSAALALGTAGMAWAEGGSGRALFAGDIGILWPHGASERSVFGSTSDPAGVIDGTNPNPDPYHAGGILSPDAAIYAFGR